MFCKKNQQLSSFPCFYYNQGNNKKNFYKSKYLLVIILFFTLILGFFINRLGVDYFIDYNNNIIIKDATIIENKKNAYPLFLLAWQEIQRSFIYIDDINKEKIDIDITKKIIKKLNCPNTRLHISPYPQVFIREIGIGIEKRKEYVKIILVEKEGSTYGKINVEDKLIYINNQNIKYLTIKKIAAKLRGEVGTEVKITVLRNEILKKFNVIRREIIDLPPLPTDYIPTPPRVEWKLKEKDIAYIEIFSFSGVLYFEFQQVKKEIIDSPANKIILDLRNNRGGDLGIVKRISESFLKRGDIILIEKKRGEYKKHFSRFNGALSNFEIIILINNNTISGAEIMAATLRDNKNSILIGERSFGKASIQRVFHLKDRYSIILTTNTWLTPRGNFINQIGIVPDYKIIDPTIQLNKALELLN